MLHYVPRFRGNDGRALPTIKYFSRLKELTTIKFIIILLIYYFNKSVKVKL
jgi:hypothetical protein